MGCVAGQHADDMDCAMRYARSTREAFASERFPAVFGPYRRESSFIGQAIRCAALLGLFAFIGTLIGAGF